MAADNGFMNLEQLRFLANSDLLKDQLLVYFDLKTQRKELQGLQKDDMIKGDGDEFDSFIGAPSGHEGI
ncbi:hypothetical protein Tco_0634043 [Tanacetum coccineum]